MPHDDPYEDYEGPASAVEEAESIQDRFESGGNTDSDDDNGDDGVLYGGGYLEPAEPGDDDPSSGTHIEPTSSKEERDRQVFGDNAGGGSGDGREATTGPESSTTTKPDREQDLGPTGRAAVADRRESPVSAVIAAQIARDRFERGAEDASRAAVADERLSPTSALEDARKVQDEFRHRFASQTSRTGQGLEVMSADEFDFDPRIQEAAVEFERELVESGQIASVNDVGIFYDAARGELVAIESEIGEEKRRRTAEDRAALALEGQLEEQLGIDVEPGVDFTTVETATGYRAEPTDALIERLASIDARARAGSGFAPDAGRAETPADRLDEQLEEELGVELDRGEDYTIEETINEEGETVLVPEFTESGRRRLALEESTSDRGPLQSDIPINTLRFVGPERFGGAVVDREEGELPLPIGLPGMDLAVPLGADAEELAARGAQAYSETIAEPVGEAVGGIDEVTLTPLSGTGAGIWRGEVPVPILPPGQAQIRAEVPEQLSRFEEAGARTGVEFGNLPAAAKTTIDALEFGKAGFEATSAGRTGEFGEAAEVAAVETVESTVEYAREKPIEFTGSVTGGLVLSAAAMGGAATIGPRAGLATRAVIQPGEEILGYGGHAATRRLAGARTAQRLFPDNEPLIFSEEFAIRQARRGIRRTRAAVDRARGRYSVDVTPRYGAGLAPPKVEIERSELQEEAERPTIGAEDISSTFGTEPTSRPRADEPGPRSDYERRRRDRIIRESEDPAYGAWREFRENQLVGATTRYVQFETEAERERLREASIPMIDEGLASRLSPRVTAGAAERLGAATEPTIESESVFDLDAEQELATEAILDLEAETEAVVEAEAEAGRELELELEAAAEAEAEQELELELEIEPIPRRRKRPRQPAPEAPSLRDVASAGEEYRAPGWLFEHTTDIALGPDPLRSYPSTEQLLPFDDVAGATGEYPTLPAITGSESERAAIADVQAFLTPGVGGFALGDLLEGGREGVGFDLDVDEEGWSF